MITDFEEITQPLDKGEKKIAMMIARYIRKFSRREKESSNGFMRQYLFQNGVRNIKSIRIRSMIHWLRVNKKIKYILANGRGYYYSKNKADLERYRISLANRINSIDRVYHSFDDAPAAPNYKPKFHITKKPPVKRKSKAAEIKALIAAAEELLNKNTTGEINIPLALANKFKKVTVLLKKKRRK